MAAYLRGGPRTIKLTRDENGYREYEVTHIVACDPTAGEGPGDALEVSGLPQPGDTLDLNLAGSGTAYVDTYVYCQVEAEVTIHDEQEGDWPKYYLVKQKFHNRGDDKKCRTTPVDDPLLEPQRISGSFIKFVEEATLDRNGDPILTSSYEFIRGPQNEWDANRPQVVIEQNVSSLELTLCAQMVDTLNNHTLWGVPPRCIKLSDVAWERKFHGACYVYYTRRLTFDIRYRRTSGVDSIGVTGTGTSTSVGLEAVISGEYETFDREVLDEGTKALHGHWSETTGNYVLDNIGGAAPSAANPHHFSRFKDRNGENTRVILNGAGLPADTTIGTGTATSAAGGFGRIRIEKYGESDFLLLGIPSEL